MKLRINRLWPLLGMLPLFGCAAALDSALDTAGRTAGARVGGAAGRYVGDRIVRHYTPQFTRLYASYMFSYAFTPGGYWVETNDYEPGDWTRWRFTENGETDGSWLERAFLRRLEDGREWWRVAMYDADSDDTVTLEALFDADRSSILRLRSQFPGQDIGEMPVGEGTPVYSEPLTLTAESLEGATVGTQTVQVPAGRFTARHVRFTDVAGVGRAEWWLVDTVPGGIVKYSTSHPHDTDEDAVEGLSEYNWTLELTETGSDATTQLGSY